MSWNDQLQRHTAAGKAVWIPDAPPKSATAQADCRDRRVYQDVGVRVNLFADDADDRTVVMRPLSFGMGLGGHPLAKMSDLTVGGFSAACTCTWSKVHNSFRLSTWPVPLG